GGAREGHPLRPRRPGRGGMAGEGPLRPRPRNIPESTGGAMRRSHRTGIPAALLAVTMPLLAAAGVRAADEPPLERVKSIALKGTVGGLDHLAIDSGRGRLFVANTSNNTLDVVDVRAGALLKQVPGQGRARGVAYSPEADRVFVGNGTGGVCSVL